MSEYLSVGQTAYTLGLTVSETLALVVGGQLEQRSTKYDRLPFTRISAASVEQYQRGAA
jgi:hypothetical protein